jgi:hypothetical protein
MKSSGAHSSVLLSGSHPSVIQLVGYCRALLPLVGNFMVETEWVVKMRTTRSLTNNRIRGNKTQKSGQTKKENDNEKRVVGKRWKWGAVDVRS